MVTCVGQPAVKSTYIKLKNLDPKQKPSYSIRAQITEGRQTKKQNNNKITEGRKTKIIIIIKSQRVESISEA